MLQHKQQKFCVLFKTFIVGCKIYILFVICLIYHIHALSPSYQQYINRDLTPGFVLTKMFTFFSFDQKYLHFLHVEQVNMWASDDKSIYAKCLTLHNLMLIVE